LLLDMLSQGQIITMESFEKEMNAIGEQFNHLSFESAIRLVNKDFLISNEHAKYVDVDILDEYGDSYAASAAFKQMLQNPDFNNSFTEILLLGKTRYNDKYKNHDEHNLVLYEKYSRKDACRILNWEKDESAIIFGYRIKYGTCPIFVTYDKDSDAIAKSTDYPDGFINEGVFKWATRSRVSLQSKEAQQIINYKDTGLVIPLFLKKSDGEGSDFYYMGTVTPNHCEPSIQKNDNGEDLPIVHFYFDMDHSVRNDVYEYFVEEAYA